MLWKWCFEICVLKKVISYLCSLICQLCTWQCIGRYGQRNSGCQLKFTGMCRSTKQSLAKIKGGIIVSYWYVYRSFIQNQNTVMHNLCKGQTNLVSWAIKNRNALMSVIGLIRWKVRLLIGLVYSRASLSHVCRNMDQSCVWKYMQFFWIYY